MPYIIIMTIATMAALALIAQVVLDAASAVWPKVQGSLEGFKIHKITRCHKFPSLEGPDKDYCYVTLRYSYEVNGRRYIGKRVNFGIDSYFSSPQGYAGHYPTPDEVEKFDFTAELRNNEFSVSYLPAFPRISVLKSGVANRKMYYFTAGFIMFAGGSLCLFSFIVTKIMN